MGQGAAADTVATGNGLESGGGRLGACASRVSSVPSKGQTGVPPPLPTAAACSPLRFPAAAATSSHPAIAVPFQADTVEHDGAREGACGPGAQVSGEEGVLGVEMAGLENVQMVALLAPATMLWPLWFDTVLKPDWWTAPPAW